MSGFAGRRARRLSAAFFAMIISAAPACLYAENLYGNEFLKLPSDAAGTAQGGSLSAGGQTANCIVRNPALPLYKKNAVISFSHLEWFSSVRYENIGIVLPIKNKYAMGLHFSSLHMPELVEKDIYGARTGRTFKFSDSRLILSGSGRILDNLGLGINLKNIAETIHDYSSSTLSWDAGVYYAPDRRLNFGASLENISGGTRLKDTELGLPLIIKFGGMGKLMNDALNISFTGTPEELKWFYYGAGVEYNFYNISFRAGLDGRIIKERAGSGITCGFGLRFGKITLDYAFVPYYALGQAHLLTLSFDYKAN